MDEFGAEEALPQYIVDIQALRDKLQGAGVTQKDIAIGAGMTPGHLTEIVGGRAPLTAATARSLAEFLHCSPEIFRRVKPAHPSAKNGEAKKNGKS